MSSSKDQLFFTRQTPASLMALWNRAVEAPNGIRFAISGDTAHIQYLRALQMRKRLYMIRKQACAELAKAQNQAAYEYQSPWGHLSIVIQNPFDGYVYIRPSTTSVTKIEEL